jgi:hypothetical protein
MSKNHATVKVWYPIHKCHQGSDLQSNFLIKQKIEDFDWRMTKLNKRNGRLAWICSVQGRADAAWVPVAKLGKI